MNHRVIYARFRNAIHQRLSSSRLDQRTSSLGVLYGHSVVVGLLVTVSLLPAAGRNSHVAAWAYSSVCIYSGPTAMAQLIVTILR